ncbi:hypothetical protein RCO28_26355 [Streptomyces sp. LHD-70]|uniref:hypothetical protein n=1 Tax=Streptomyces sp. LHD-70 TaxID=3072140 RepID=UPI00280CE390|nr:hypothetical protein [Streptomyces sp. LHD-70]MDQ8705979.1 hypothetical protein [Streptomyces sp. LHD-70]
MSHDRRWQLRCGPASIEPPPPPSPDSGPPPGDGLRGYEPHAPYDRIIATRGVRDLPYARVAQCPPEVSSSPLGTQYRHQDAVVRRLVVAEDGWSAGGRFTGPVQFMKARGQRLAWPRHEECAALTSPRSASPSQVLAPPYGWMPRSVPPGLERAALLAHVRRRRHAARGAAVSAATRAVSGATSPS